MAVGQICPPSVEPVIKLLFMKGEQSFIITSRGLISWPFSQSINVRPRMAEEAAAPPAKEVWPSGEEKAEGGRGKGILKDQIVFQITSNLFIHRWF